MYDPNPEETSLAIPAADPTMNELMNRRPPFPRKDLRMLVRMQRSERAAWRNAADVRRDKRENEE